MIKLLISDVAGTSVKDDGLVTKAFTLAMLDMGEVEDSLELNEMVDYVNKTMGERKIDVFRHLCDGDFQRAQAAHDRFVEHYISLVKKGEIEEMPGALGLFRSLRKRGISIGLTTGFPREILNEIITSLNWQEEVDFSVAASEVERGRPYPDMINLCIDQYNHQISEKITASEVAVVGDTVSDIKSGLAANAALIIGVTSGAHSGEQLVNEGADYVFDSISGLDNFFR